MLMKTIWYKNLVAQTFCLVCLAKKILDWLAGRSRSKDENDIEVRVISGKGKVESHTTLHTTQEVIDWINEQLNDEEKQ